MSSEDFDVQLELKERIDFPDYIEGVFKSINSAFNNEKISRVKVQEMILNFFYDIPRSWKDKQFEDDIKGIITERKVPNVIKFCGYHMSKEFMKKHKIPLTKKIRNINYFKMKNAIINLLDRLNMLVRKDKIEMSTGRNLRFETLDDLIASLEVLENEETEI